jgi:hypothetical protein
MEIAKQDEKIPEMQSQATCSRQRANDGHGHGHGHLLALSNKGLQVRLQRAVGSEWLAEGKRFIRFILFKSL